MIGCFWIRRDWMSMLMLATAMLVMVIMTKIIIILIIKDFFFNLIIRICFKVNIQSR